VTLPEQQTSPWRWLAWWAASSAPPAPQLSAPRAYTASLLVEEEVEPFQKKKTQNVFILHKR